MSLDKTSSKLKYMLTDIKNIRTKNTKRLYILTDNDIYNLTILALKGLSTNQQPKPNHIEQQQDQQQQQEQQQQQQQPDPLSL